MRECGDVGVSLSKSCAQLKAIIASARQRGRFSALKRYVPPPRRLIIAACSIGSTGTDGFPQAAQRSRTATQGGGVRQYAAV